MKGDADLEIICPRCGLSGDENVERLRRHRIVCRQCGIVKCSQPTALDGRRRPAKKKRGRPRIHPVRKPRIHARPAQGRKAGLPLSTVLCACLRSGDPELVAAARARLQTLLEGVPARAGVIASLFDLSPRQARRLVAALRSAA